jgi:hypothetical protein
MTASIANSPCFAKGFLALIFSTYKSASSRAPEKLSWRRRLVERNKRGYRDHLSRVISISREMSAKERDFSPCFLS